MSREELKPAYFFPENFPPKVLIEINFHIDGYMARLETNWERT